MEATTKNVKLEDAMRDHPSICYECIHSRKPWSNELRDQGYVGCCLRAKHKPGRSDFDAYDHDEITEAKEIAEGWVDLRSNIFSLKGSGIVTNLMLITMEVKSCRQFVMKQHPKI